MSQTSARKARLSTDHCMGDFTVKEKEQLKALDFIIDPKGSWSLHVQQTAADVRKRLGAIRRVAHLLDNQGIMMAYSLCEI